jgi:hypothetical protein
VRIAGSFTILMAATLGVASAFSGDATTWIIIAAFGVIIGIAQFRGDIFAGLSITSVSISFAHACVASGIPSAFSWLVACVSGAGSIAAMVIAASRDANRPIRSIARSLLASALGTPGLMLAALIALFIYAIATAA